MWQALASTRCFNGFRHLFACEYSQPSCLRLEHVRLAGGPHGIGLSDAIDDVRGNPRDVEQADDGEAGLLKLSLMEPMVTQKSPLRSKSSATRPNVSTPCERAQRRRRFVRARTLAARAPLAFVAASAALVRSEISARSFPATAAERVHVRPQLGHDEGNALRHQAGNEMHVAG